MILSLETSTRRASLALWDPATDTCVDESQFETDRAHNAAIFAPLEALLAGRRQALSGIAVGVGPGSYGGVRVGIAVANGLAMTLGLPAAGLSSLEAWKTRDGATDYLVTGDARRKSFFLAEIKDRKLVGEPELLSRETLLERLDGSVLSCYSADASACQLSARIQPAYPQASLIGALAAKRWQETWPDVPLEPHYLRAPYITVPREPAGE